MTDVLQCIISTTEVILSGIGAAEIVHHVIHSKVLHFHSASDIFKWIMK